MRLQFTENVAPAWLVIGAARHDHVTPVPESYVNCTGFLSANEYSSNSPPSSISRCLILFRDTRLTTVISSPTSEPVGSTLPTTGCATLHKLTSRSKTELLQLCMSNLSLCKHNGYSMQNKIQIDIDLC